ncbi:MAG: hypothetical protein LBI39_02005 [Puniceicoccales bacterium]|nr:hypothetical protein [Puniceicoccales bacterium]
MATVRFHSASLFFFLALAPNLWADELNAAKFGSGFFLPSYDAKGGLAWEARGSCAEMDKKTRLMILRNVSVQFFSNFIRQAKTIAFVSQFAKFDGESDSMSGEGFIHVSGDGFTAIGSHWTFRGRERAVQIDRDVQAFFECTENLNCSDHSDDCNFTATCGGRLHILDGEGMQNLHFTGPVRLWTQNYSLCCDKLSVKMAAQRSEEVCGQELPSEPFHRIHGSGHVAMDDPERHVEAGDVLIFVGNGGAIVFSGDVAVSKKDGEESSGQLALLRGGRLVFVDDGGSCLGIN